jgi:hypothetical protein
MLGRQCQIVWIRLVSRLARAAWFDRRGIFEECLRVRGASIQIERLRRFLLSDQRRRGVWGREAFMAIAAVPGTPRCRHATAIWRPREFVHSHCCLFFCCARKKRWERETSKTGDKAKDRRRWREDKKTQGDEVTTTHEDTSCLLHCLSRGGMQRFASMQHGKQQMAGSSQTETMLQTGCCSSDRLSSVG